MMPRTRFVQLNHTACAGRDTDRGQGTHQADDEARPRLALIAPILLRASAVVATREAINTVAHSGRPDRDELLERLLAEAVARCSQHRQPSPHPCPQITCGNEVVPMGGGMGLMILMAVALLIMIAMGTMWLIRHSRR